MRRISKYLLLGCLLLALGACKVTPPANSNVSNQIDKTLQAAIYNNNKVAAQKPQKMPAFVNNALAPKLTLTPAGQAQAQQKRFNITVKDMPARDFFMGLVKNTNLSMMVSPKINGTISLNLKKVTIPEVLNAVENVYGYEYTQTAYGYEISPRELETRMFAVNYLDVARKGSSETTVSSGQITSRIHGSANTTTTTQQQVKPSSSVTTESDSNFWGELKAAVETIVGKREGTKVVINPDAGVVLVRAYPQTLNNVAKYLDSIQNIMQREVMLEAEILEVHLNAGFQSGVDWQALGLQQTGITSRDGNSQNFNDDLKSFTNIFRLYFRPGSDFKAIINLLNSQGRVNVLSSPRISTLNNQKAVIKVGKDNFYITNVESETTAQATTNVIAQDVDFTPFFSGIALDVTPEIANNGDVILHIHPIISRVTDDTKNYTINNQAQSIPMAESTIRESDNIVRAKNGQIIVIGGLMEGKNANYGASTPGADKLPGVSGLFKRQHQMAEKTELVILLKPIVVGKNTWQRQLQQTARQFQNLHGDFSYTSKLDKNN